MAFDLHSIAVVDGIGVIKLLNYIEPGYRVPSRPHIKTTCRQEYNALKEALVKELHSPRVSLTTDIWFSRATEGYITVTVHWISDDWKLQNKVLFTSEISERHTGVNIAERLSQGSVQWGIPKKHVVVVVYDNLSNMTCALEKLPFGECTMCCPYTTINSYQRIKVSEVFRLTEKQKQLNVKEHHLIQDVATTWNLVYFMFERLQEQQWAIYAVLHDEQVTEAKYRSL